MNTVRAKVLRGVRVQAGWYLDGVAVAADTFVQSGVHEFGADYVDEMQWVDRGLIELTSPRDCCCAPS